MEKKSFKLSEQFSITDLDKGAISNLTRSWLTDREDYGNNEFDLYQIAMKNDCLYLFFRAEPSHDDAKFSISKKGNKVRTDHYNTVIEVDNVSQEIGSPEEFAQFSPQEKNKVVSNFILNGLCRVWCSCPSFYFQSHWEYLGKKDDSIFKFPGPKGTDKWHSIHAMSGGLQHNLHICKHLGAAFHKLMLGEYVKVIVKYIVQKYK